MTERTGDRPPFESRQDDAGRSDAEAPSPARRSGRRFGRAAALGALGLVAAAAAVLAIRPPHGGPTAAQSSGEASIGGPFTLVGVDGKPVDQHVLDGKWSAVFFGYTNCPDTCPATLQALNAVGQQLGALRSRYQVVFISVDPARDTPGQMKLYTSSQGYPAGGLIGLTGAPGEVKRITDEYHAFYAKTGSGPDYEVQHTAAVYLMDPHGRFVKPLNETDPPSTLAAQVRSAMTGKDA